jgi:putative spermidine/putrescine transport system substrate-binding protein
MAVVLDLMKYLLTPAAQAYTYDDGYFYPGPAIKNVPISMAPASSQQVIAKYGRSEYDVWIPEYPTEVPLSAADLTYAFNRWNQDIAGQHNYTG